MAPAEAPVLKEAVPAPVAASFARKVGHVIDHTASPAPIDGAAIAEMLRSGWSDLEPLLRDALDGGALDAEAVAQALAPDAPPVLRLAPALGTGVKPRTVTPLRLRFTMLGGFAAHRGNRRIEAAEWGRPMAARIVRFLLVHRDRVVPEDFLLEAFWPQATPESARRGLQVAVSRARAVLDAPGAERSIIEYTQRSYRLRLGDADVLDCDEFEVLADWALATGEPPSRRRRRLEEAAAAWTGDPLPEQRYDEWSIAWRERLRDRYIEVLSALAEARSEAGDHAAAIDAAREVVALDPLNEGAHRELMTAYARAGRTAQALNQFLECRRVLVDELGVEPSHEMRALQAKVLDGQTV